MFFSRQSSAPAEDLSSKINRLKTEIDSADAVVIGAGAGLSTSAGFTYDGERFKKYFSDFEEKYGFHDMYSGGFYPYRTPEEYWAYWSRYIWINRYMDPPEPVYDDLLSIIKDKDYFVITTNVDHCFQKAGFDKERLFYTQGDYGLFQCSLPCHQQTYDNRSVIRPRCGRPMTMNLRSDDKFVKDEGWHKAAQRYENFLRTRSGQRTLFFELGVGFNTPGIVKFSFWRMTAENPKAIYACINLGEAGAPREIASRSICIDGDIGEVLK